MKKKIIAVLMAFAAIFSMPLFFEIGGISKNNMLYASADVESTALAEAFAKLDLLIDEDLLNWNASLYEPEVGGFYISQSARDTEGFYPDVQSTMQAIGFLALAGFPMESDMPGEVADKMVNWVKGLQSPDDGYFYHPQWGKEISETKKNRDLTYSLKIVNQYGDGEFYYGDPTDKDYSGAAMLMAAADDYLQSEENLRLWLEDKWENSRNHYSAASTIQAAKTAIVGAGYEDIVIDFILEKQNSETGLWDDTLDYNAVGTCYKFTDYFHGDRKLPHADKIILSMISILKDEPATAIVDPYNTVNTILTCYQTFGSDVPDYVQQAIDDNLTELINVTVEQYKKFRKDDGGYSYYPEKGIDYAYGSVMALGIAEGDMDSPGKVLSTRNALYTLSGGKAAKPYSDEVYWEYLKKLKDECNKYTYTDKEYSIAAERCSNHLALSSVYYTAEQNGNESRVSKVVPHSTISVYSDIINTYTLRYMTYLRKNRYEHSADNIDAQFNLIMCAFDDNLKLQACKISKLDLPVYPGGGLSYRQNNVKIGSIDITDNNTSFLKTFVLRKAIEEESDSIGTQKNSDYIKSNFAFEFKPLVLSSKSSDNEINAVSLNGTYGYVNHDRNTVRFIFEGERPSDENIAFAVAEGAALRSEGTIAEGNLKFVITAENEDEKEYKVIIDDNYTKAFEEDFSNNALGDTEVSSLTLTNKGGDTKFNIENKTGDSSDMVLCVSHSTSGDEGGIMISPTALSGSGDIKSSLFKFDINLKSIDSGSFSWYAGSEILGAISKEYTSDGISDNTRFSLGTSFTSNADEALALANSVFAGSNNTWHTFCILGSMKKQYFGNTPIGSTAHQYIEVYSVADDIPIYLGEYFIFDRNKNESGDAMAAQGEISYSTYIDDLNGFETNGEQWGFGIASSKAVGEFSLDNLLILRK